MQKRYRLLSIMLITAACIILVIGILLSPSSSVDKDVFVAFKPGTGAGEVILSTNNGQRVILSSSQVDTLLERPIDLLQKNKMLDYRQEEKTKIPEIHTLQTSCSSFYQITLSDGTQVWLNAESQLIYPSLFTGEERVVELCGEGFFKVAHDSLRPFKVKVENIVTAPKTDMFRFRINPEIKKQVEDVYAKNGLTLTQALNIFIQQSINAGGFPFQVNEENAELIKARAMERLMKELEAGENSGELIDEAEAYRLLGVTEL